ncbi:MAG: (d)CMP kinase, partial [Oscillospiraceae bacterium]|nr:(d)CMP kinase [Oscillospiraceae bacterium]
MSVINVAIDGPAGAGKSTIARAAAKALGYLYADTGALYRSIAYYAVSNGIDISDKAAVTGCLGKITAELRYENGEQCVYLNGKNVSPYIRTPEISMGASAVSAIPAVRAFLLDLQKDIAASNSVIMDGRDIGTVVLPDADVKIYLTASAEVRAKRRFDELSAKGAAPDYEKVLADIIQRD